MSEGNGKGTPWPEEPTPFESDIDNLGPPPIAEHANICSQVRMLWQTHKASTIELHNVYLAIHRARVPIGPGILDDIAAAIEMNISGAQETVLMLREQAARMRAGETPP